VYAVDTNVVVRVLVGDDPRQRRAALARLRAIRAEGGHAVVGVVVLAELGWVLASAYGYDRTQVAAALRGIMNTPPFVVSRRAEVLAAIEAYEKGAADFADYLILSLARSEGCSTLLTFDRRLSKTRGCEAP
jgi:predicted nucleic-acid-binding protein